MTNKLFAERLNQGLDDIGVPSLQHERIEAFAILIDVPRFKAESLLNGQALLDDELLEKIAKELEVQKDWLLGQ